MKTRLPSTRSWLKLLTPGIGVKRWVALLLAGAAIVGFGIALIILSIYQTHPLAPGYGLLTLGGAPRWLRIALALATGTALIVLAITRLSRLFLEPLKVSAPDLIEAMVEHRQRQRGPEIVAIGGGTGLPTLLRGLKAYTANLTAIVTVADDGGSSGRLRRDLGVLPPGDFRNNLAALARDEDLMTHLFQYRFGEGGLEGHSFGNLFITALSGITGSFEQALVESSRVLAIRGRVLPSTLADVTLVADLREEQITRRVEGESVIPEAVGTIERVYLRPEDAPAYPGAVSAILNADLVVLGPGSLFTSILPNLLVRGIADALRATRAVRVYVCNVATQHGETEGFDVLDHVRAIERQTGPGVLDVVLANDHFPPLDADANFEYVRLPGSNGSDPGVRLVTASLIDDQRHWRHHPERLARAVVNVLERRPGAAL